MQLMINTNEETRETLLLASRFLAEHAGLLPAAETAEPGINGPGHKIELVPDVGHNETHVSVPGGTFPTNVADASARIAAAGLVPVVPPAPPAPSNVLPFVVPPAPPAPTTAVTNAATPPVSGTPASAPAAASAATTPSTGAGATAVEYDSAGLAWDDRIHQQGRNKKRDGTWMLKRRVDAALVEQVTKELLARKGTPSVADGAPIAPNHPGVTVGPLVGALAGAPTAPVFVPPPPAQDPAAVFGPAEGSAPAAAAAVTLPAAGPVFVPPPPAMAGVSAPPASASVPDVSNGAGVAIPAANPLRDFVMKCARLTSSGMITKEQQDAALQQAGVPGMQALATMQHLIPQADYFVSKAAGLVA